MSLAEVFRLERPALVLAPMQDVTDLAFMKVIAGFGGPDLFVTEYFRVHRDSRLEPHILRSITENTTGKPVLAQLIGQEIPALIRNVRELKNYPVAGIDLNLGCPAPVVCRKDAGGGLLRLPEKLDQILGVLREECGELPFTIKTRLGFDSPEEFSRLIPLLAKHQPDLLTVHGRTVRERYQTAVHPHEIQRAVEEMGCPVVANGNVVNAATGNALLRQTGAAGLMIGRGAIRHPWIFSQLRKTWAGENPEPVPRHELLRYIELLYHSRAAEVESFEDQKHVRNMKKFLIYISQGVPGDFEFEIRRAVTERDFFSICRRHLDCGDPLPELPPESSKLFCGFGSLLESGG